MTLSYQKWLENVANFGIMTFPTTKIIKNYTNILYYMKFYFGWKVSFSSFCRFNKKKINPQMINTT